MSTWSVFRHEIQDLKDSSQRRTFNYSKVKCLKCGRLILCASFHFSQTENVFIFYFSFILGLGSINWINLEKLQNQPDSIFGVSCPSNLFRILIIDLYKPLSNAIMSGISFSGFTRLLEVWSNGRKSVTKLSNIITVYNYHFYCFHRKKFCFTQKWSICFWGREWESVQIIVGFLKTHSSSILWPSLSWF